MYPYWALFSVFALGSLLSSPERRGKRFPPLLAFAAIAVALMIGLRYQVGGDWSNYATMFGYIRYSDFGALIKSGLGDFGYMLINWISVQLEAGIWLVNLICATIFVAGLSSFAAREPNPWLTFLIAVPYLIIVVAMGYTRQSVAIGLSLGALAAFTEGRNRRFFLLMLVAVLFHKSAIVLLPLIGMGGTRNRHLIIAQLIVLCGLIYWLVVADSIEALRENYLNAELQSEGAAVRVFMNVVPALLFLIFSRRFGLNDNQRLLWRNMSLAALLTLAALLLVSSSTVVDRLALYLVPLQLMVLGRLPQIFSHNQFARLFLVFLVIAYSGLVQFVWLNYASHAELWIPYQLYPIGSVNN